MAQLQEKSDSGKGNKRRARKHTTSLDMTPMVDLAFLLLTFFMLTTTFSKPFTMELQMPVKPDNPKTNTTISGKNALTIVLGKNNTVYYYFGFAGDTPQVVASDFSAAGIRQVLLSERVKSNPQMVVLIKSMKESRYRNLVDVLDEMKITATKKYALAELEKSDLELVMNTATE